MPFAQTTHRYNGQNQRILRENGQGQTVYVYGRQGHEVLGEYQPAATLRWNNGLSTEHVWLSTASGAMPIAAVINGEQSAVHSDHLNTPRRMTDKDGKVRWQWAYSGFGEVSAQSLTTDSLPERRLNLRYAGQVDDGNGLFYNWHRFYHPDTGRYAQSDPIGLAGGLNRFGYVGGNAMVGVDPMGLAPGDVFKTRDDAAVDAGDYARTLNPQFVEHGGWIFPKGDGYSYNLIKGNPGSVPRSKMNDLKQKCTLLQLMRGIPIPIRGIQIHK